MTPCGFYLLFCRGFVCSRLHTPVAEVYAHGLPCVYFRGYRHIFKYAHAKALTPRFLSDITDIYRL